ncbi:MAG: hypothetical protein FWC33_02065 [Candidatus Bathyarchaeota archaeon]|nr:hypothetical protein [Candidatus Termiticorpusculum sp.]
MVDDADVLIAAYWSVNEYLVTNNKRRFENIDEIKMLIGKNKNKRITAHFTLKAIHTK